MTRTFPGERFERYPMCAYVSADVIGEHFYSIVGSIASKPIRSDDTMFYDRKHLTIVCSCLTCCLHQFRNEISTFWTYNTQTLTPSVSFRPSYTSPMLYPAWSLHKRKNKDSGDFLLPDFYYGSNCGNPMANRTVATVNFEACVLTKYW